MPGLTQNPVTTGGTFGYEFTAPDPGTYFFHPHVGVQLDRGLYAPLIIDDPQEPGGYDTEWVLVLEDWIDGTGTTPDQVLAKLIADGGPTPMGMPSRRSATSGGMDGMGDGELMTAKVHPTHAHPAQKVRLRIISARLRHHLQSRPRLDGGHRWHVDGHRPVG